MYLVVLRLDEDLNASGAQAFFRLLTGSPEKMWSAVEHFDGNKNLSVCSSCSHVTVDM